MPKPDVRASSPPKRRAFDTQTVAETQAKVIAVADSEEQKRLTEKFKAATTSKKGGSRDPLSKLLSIPKR